MIDFGTVRPGTTLYIPFATYDSNDPSASVTLTGLATSDIEIYKDGSVTQRSSDSGYALLDTDGIDFDSTTGIHGISINLADNTDAGFYAAGSQYWVVVQTLKCIRCGCCLNICPVYQQIGGYAYGWFISGPIGAIFTPLVLGTQAGRQLLFASTLFGACVDVCPVKIPITDILLHLRHRIFEGDKNAPAVIPEFLHLAVKSARISLNTPWIYRLGSQALKFMMHAGGRSGWIQRLPAPANRWTKVRPFPAFNASFRQQWNKKRKGG